MNALLLDAITPTAAASRPLEPDVKAPRGREDHAPACASTVQPGIYAGARSTGGQPEHQEAFERRRSMASSYADRGYVQALMKPVSDQADR